MSNIFDSFTNQYSLSKTLRFELRPVLNTKKMLEDDRVFEKDKLIQEKYQKTKPFFDRLHREFVQEALESVHLSGLNGYFSVFEEWQKDKKNKDIQKKLEKEEGKLRKEVVIFFDSVAKHWVEDNYSALGLKKKDVNVFFEEDVFSLLKARYGNDDASLIQDETTGKMVSIFDSWKGFTGYFGKFWETRKNFYKDDGTATAHATRIIDQNLKRFCDNLQVFAKIRGKVDFSEIEQNFSESVEGVFSLDFYNKCLLQEGINFYNKILGGEVLGNGAKLKGVNELINKYRQDHKEEKVPFLKLLDKQILSEKQRFLDGIENDAELLDVLKKFYETAEEKISVLQSLLVDFIKNNNHYQLQETYISKEAFNTISRRWTNETDKFEGLLYDSMKSDKLVSKKDDGYKFPDFISLSYVKTALGRIDSFEKFWKEKYYRNLEDPNSKGFLIGNESVWEQFLNVFQFEFKSLFEREIINNETGGKMKVGYDVFKKDFKELIDLKSFSINPITKITIKNFADVLLKEIYAMTSYFAVEKKRKWNPENLELGDFYTNPDFGYENFYRDAYERIVQPYNHLRNYLTKKPYSEEKWKLNFENNTLADGWDKNKESDNFAIILRKGAKYYLGLMKKGCSKIFDDRNKAHFSTGIDSEKYEKMIYKYLPDAAKMIPKCSTQLKFVQDHFVTSSDPVSIDSKTFSEPLLISKRIFNLNNIRYDKTNISQMTDDEKNGTKMFQKEYLKLSNDEKSYKSALSDWINFCKDFLKKYISTKDFDLSSFKKTEEYNSLDEFYDDIEKISYRISFLDISENYINEKNKTGELYLFEIHNKDWNLSNGSQKTGSKNLHTLYFESLFSDENIQNNFPIKLNGQAEIFYRPKTDDIKLGKKKDQKGKEVIDHKRYAVNKVFFHVPLTLNRGKGETYNYNAKINDFLANNPAINIIGVDRGEKHLAYYSVITQKGDILARGSLNTINKVNYAEKLAIKAGNREQARKDWQAIEGIKDLKKGYISQVVRKLADLAIEHNAIIVFEDLNMRFKQIRGGIEKSIYQQLEKALIEKLSFLVNKGEKNPQQAGHLLKAYQLAAPFTTFKEMGKQTGIVFYTQASYTSKIDPVTGWRPNLYLKYSSAEKAKMDILNFSNIEFKDERFEFVYDLKSFQKQKEYPRKTNWTVCSSVERFRWDKNLNQNKGGYLYYANITDHFRELLGKHDIDFLRGDIKGQIEVLDAKGNEKFFKEFIFLFNLICQIRNTNDSEKAKKEGKDDFILSPVEPFFDSRNIEKFGENLPQNGDDNGAFNIARKGIILLDKISEFSNKNGDCHKMSWADLYVSHIDWDNFACSHNKK